PEEALSGPRTAAWPGSGIQLTNADPVAVLPAWVAGADPEPMFVHVWPVLEDFEPELAVPELLVELELERELVDVEELSVDALAADVLAADALAVMVFAVWAT
ncbi:MAG: hypothetical protein ACLPYW_06915, partial [Acidimicrobiales bacterium]